MSAFHLKLLLTTPRFLLPVAVLGVSSVGCAVLARRAAAPEPLRRVASATLPMMAKELVPNHEPHVVRESPSPGSWVVPAEKPMRGESVTHPFEKNTPPPEPLYDEFIGPDGNRAMRMRPVEGVVITAENAYRVGETSKRRVAAYIEPPLSLVSRTKPTALYSREINRPLCVARAGAKEWVGTGMGVKCVDRKRKIVRIFSAPEGLPVGRVEQIATDDSGDGAVALVRRMEIYTDTGQTHALDGKPVQIAVCLYDTKRSRWDEIGELPIIGIRADDLPSEKRNRFGHDYRISYQVALTAKRVVVVPSAVRTDGETAFAIFDRVTGEQQSSHWEETLQADHPLIVINAVAKRGDTLLLGTDIGLLLYDTATKLWQRALPVREIVKIAVGEGRDASAVVLTVPRGSGNGYSSPSDFQLLAVSLRTGKAAANPPKKLPANRSGDGALTVAPEGALWLTYADCFYKADSGTTGWTKINDAGEPVTDQIGRPTRHSLGDDFDPFYYKPVLPVAAEARVPDNAATARILSVRNDSPFERGGDLVSGREPMRWMRQRFARCLSPAGNAEEPIPLPTTDSHAEPVSGFVPDPSDDRMAFGLQGESLIHLPKKTIPDDEPHLHMPYDIAMRRYKPLSPAAAARNRATPLPLVPGRQ